MMRRIAGRSGVRRLVCDTAALRERRMRRKVLATAVRPLGSMRVGKNSSSVGATSGYAAPAELMKGVTRVLPRCRTDGATAKTGRRKIAQPFKAGSTGAAAKSPVRDERNVRSSLRDLRFWAEENPRLKPWAIFNSGNAGEERWSVHPSQ